MTRDEKRIAIAQACGIIVCESCCNKIDPDCCCCGSPMDWHTIGDEHSPVPMGCRCGYDKQPQSKWGGVPDYFGSLDAMHEAESYAYKISRPGWASHYNEILVRITGKSHDTLQYNWSWHATAEQRAEAFGLALGLWKEGE